MTSAFKATANAQSASLEASAAPPRRYVAYYRVSTSRQANQGFGLEAQQIAVASYIDANNGKLIAEFAETRSGYRGHQPRLADALRLAGIFQATLLIARLDRLSRNVAMIAALMKAKIDFVAIDFPHATRFTLHILAAIAEHESRLISDRVKLAQAAARARGYTRANTKQNRAFPPGCRELSGIVRHARSQARINDLAPLVWRGVAEGKSYALIAGDFNQQGIRPATSAPWQQNSIGNIARRTSKAFATIAAARPTNPLGLRRAKVLSLLEEVGPLLLGWEAKGQSYSFMARELNRLGHPSPRGGSWERVSARRYLNWAKAAPAIDPSCEAA